MRVEWWHQGVVKGFAAGLMAVTLTACGGGGGSGGDAINVPPSPAFSPTSVCTGANRSGWCWQNPQPYGTQLRDMQFTDAQNGWAVGDAGAMLRTRDGGRSWTDAFLPTRDSLVALRFADPRHGWLFAINSGKVWRTTDAGDTWLPGSPLPADVVTGVALLKGGALVVNAEIWAPTFKQFTLISEDGGLTWRESAALVTASDPNGTLWNGVLSSNDLGRTFAADQALSQTLRSVSPVVGEELFLRDMRFGEGGFTAATSQFGSVPLLVKPGASASWTASRSPAVGPGDYIGAYLVGSTGGWVELMHSGGRIDAMHSTDGGLHWQSRPLPSADAAVDYMQLQPIDALSASLYIRDAAGTVRLFITSDGGATWQPLTPPAGPLDQLPQIVPDAGGGWVGWFDGAPYRSLSHGGHWLAQPIPSLGVPSIVSLAFVDAQHGFAITLGNTMLETSDAGQHWRVRADSFAPQVDVWVYRSFISSDLQFTPSGQGWLVSNNRLWRSVDAGGGWSPVAVPATTSLPHIDFSHLQFVSDLHGRASVRFECFPTTHGITFQCKEGLVVTNDGGKTWRDTGAEVTGGFAFADASVGVRLANGELSRSTDGGVTWTVASTDVSTPLPYNARLRFADASNVWLVSDGMVLRSRDAGQHWQTVTMPPVLWPLTGTSPTNNGWNDVRFADALHGWMVGNFGAVARTDDGGNTWTLQTSGAAQNLNTVFALNANTAWVAGDNGAILNTTTAGK